MVRRGFVTFFFSFCLMFFFYYYYWFVFFFLSLLATPGCLRSREERRLMGWELRFRFYWLSFLIFSLFSRDLDLFFKWEVGVKFALLDLIPNYSVTLMWDYRIIPSIPPEHLPSQPRRAKPVDLSAPPNVARKTRRVFVKAERMTLRFPTHRDISVSDSVGFFPLYFDRWLANKRFW